MNHLSEDILMELADNTLLPEQKKEAELHLLQCKQCSDELAMFQSLSTLLVQENMIKAPAQMATRVMTQIELHQKIMVRKAKSRNTVIRFAAIMFGLLAALLGLGCLLGSATQVGPGFQIPVYFVNALHSLESLKIPIKNPTIVYVVSSFLIILFTERVYSIIKHRKITA
ncbi:MAG: hypothetical protein WCQ95_06085 [Bacteroidota bacterium]